MSLPKRLFRPANFYASTVIFHAARRLVVASSPDKLWIPPSQDAYFNMVKLCLLIRKMPLSDFSDEKKIRVVAKILSKMRADMTVFALAVIDDKQIGLSSKVLDAGNDYLKMLNDYFDDMFDINTLIEHERVSSISRWLEVN
jgi:hypothetical protein